LTLALLVSGSALGADDASHCLALAIYWEAKGCDREDMAAVGHVVLNRLGDGEFPDDICAVVKEGGEAPPCQFSRWCDGKGDEPDEDEPWRLAREVAADLLVGPPPDPTGGARFFHSKDIESPFADERERTAATACHVFYR
jgi:spore germination cell wall hydrolase CwlJ-like protein